MWATTQQPFLMGILVSVIVGVALTLPISSAAICAALGLTGLAGGAAVAGCCAQMIGFAVISFRDNGWGGFFAQGIGTSMLQVPNIIKNPVSYTHLDVYKRQSLRSASSSCALQISKKPFGKEAPGFTPFALHAREISL